MLDGLMPVTKGARASTVKGSEFVVCPVSLTATWATPCACKEVARIVPVNCVALKETGVIVEELPLMVTTIFASEVKPLPSTVKESKSGSPALAEVGEMEVMPKAATPGKITSHIPRPCVAARRVRDGW